MDFLFHLFATFALASGVMVIKARNPVHSVLFLILVFFNGAGLLLLLGLDFFAFILLVVYVGAIAVLFLFVVMMLNLKIAEINEKRLRYLPIGGLIGILFVFETFLIIDNHFIDLMPLSVSSFSFPTLEEVGFVSSNLSVSGTVPIKEGLCDQLITSPLGYETKGIELLSTKEQGKGTNRWMTFPLFIQNHLEWSVAQAPITNIESIGQLLYTYYFLFFILSSIILLVAMIGAILLTMQKGVAVERQKVFTQNIREHGKTVIKAF